MRIFSTVTARSAIALSISSRSPPGSVTAPRMVSVHQSSAQFCWKGVTGIITAWIGGFGASGASASDMAGGRDSGGRMVRLKCRAGRGGASPDLPHDAATQAAPAAARSAGLIHTAVSWNATPPIGPTASAETSWLMPIPSPAGSL